MQQTPKISAINRDHSWKLAARLCLMPILLISVSFSSYAQTSSSSFPQYIDTGDATQDAANYQQAKQQWIANNPVAYQQMTSPSITPAAVSLSIISTETFNQMSPEKQAAVLAHPEHYQIGSHNKQTVSFIDEADFNSMPANKQAVILANPDIYKIKPAAPAPLTPSNKIIVYRSEMNAMPADKVNEITTNPNQYEIVE